MSDSNPTSNTHKDPALDAVPAGIWRKIFAWVYDVFLVMGLLVFLGFIELAVVQAIDSNLIKENPDFFRESTVQLIGVIVVVTLYYVINWVRSGRTLGMLAWGLMLVGDNGKTISWPQAMGRAAVSLFGLAMLISPFNQRKQGLHDLLCQTRVVRLEQKGRLSKSA